MKFAVACEGTQVAQHFGHCEQFAVYEAGEGKIISVTHVANPGHRPGFLPVFLHGFGISAIVSGGMGGGAIEIFNEKGIDVYTGASGEVNAVALQLAQGTLKSTGSICHEHAHADDCH
jgi:predicted Fe-Mo cluster-binding NifX family protein